MNRLPMEYFKATMRDHSKEVAASIAAQKIAAATKAAAAYAKSFADIFGIAGDD